MSELEKQLKQPLSKMKSKQSVSMCGNQNTHLLIQNYLREEFCNGNEIKLVDKFCELFCNFGKKKDPSMLIRLLIKICVVSDCSLICT